MQEKPLTSISGYIILLVAVLCLLSSVAIAIARINFWLAGALFLVAMVLFTGITVINPNEAYVSTLFGDYIGTMKQNSTLR